MGDTNRSTQHKIVTIEDGDKKVRVQIHKFDAVTMYFWLVRLITVLAKSGFPVPTSIPTALKEVGAAVADAARTGRIFQMPGLVLADLQGLLAPLMEQAYFINENPTEGMPAMEQASSDRAVNKFFSSPLSIFALQAEVISFSLGFSEDENGSDSVLGKLRSGLQSTPTSPPSSPPSSQGGGPRLRSVEPSTV